VVAGAWWGGYDGCWTYRPVYDAAGNYLGYSNVNIVQEPRSNFLKSKAA
jgi:hypothetical protein